MSLRDRASHAAFWSGVGWITTYLLQFIVTIITARLLAPEIFGLVALVLVLVGVVAVFAEAGTYAAIIQFDDVEDVVASALVAVPLMGLIGTVAVGGTSWWLADFYGEPDLQPVALAMSGLLFLGALTIVPDALLARRFQVRARKAVVNPLAIALYGAVVIVFATLGAGVWSLVAGQYASALCFVVASWYLARPLRGAGRPRWSAWARVRRYGRSLLFANLLEVVREQAITVVVGRGLGATATGLWGAGLRLAQLPVIGITHVAGSVVFPALSRLQGDPDRLRARFLESLRLIAMLVIPVCATLGALGTPLVAILFGERWRPAGEVLSILSAWALLLSLVEAAKEIFKARGRTAIVARAVLVECIGMVAVLVVLWLADAITLLSVAAAPVVGVAAAAVVAVLALRSVTAISPGDLWRTLGTGIVGGAAQAAAMLVIVHVALPDLASWTEVGGVDLGPVIPSLILAAIAAVGAGVFVVACEAVERGSIVSLIGTMRSVAAARGADARRDDDGDDDDPGGPPLREPDPGPPAPDVWDEADDLWPPGEGPTGRRVSRGDQA